MLPISAAFVEDARYLLVPQETNKSIAVARKMYLIVYSLNSFSIGVSSKRSELLNAAQD